MELKDLKLIAAMLRREGIEEFEWKSGNEFIRIKRCVGDSFQDISVRPSESESNKQKQETPAKSAKKGPSPGNQYITSPIVGTFYRSPSPKSDPFVQEGDRTAKGQVLCILEAMKLMNELESEYPCIIKKILVENAQSVEFGQPLFEVKPL